MTTADLDTPGPERQPRILIVDDDPVVLELLEQFITGFGHQVRTATDGQAAIELLGRESFDLIITDMIMPRLDGMALLHHTRRHFPHIDIIVATGHPATFSYTDVIRAGAIDFITKPFGRDELEAKINRALRERRIIRQLEQLSRRDPLTGLFNRRYFATKLKEEIIRGTRQGYPVFLALVDVDNFKAYNDQHGHQAGDQRLVQVGRLLRACIRSSVDWAFRYGGDEFALILPHISQPQAIEIVHRLLVPSPGNHNADHIPLSIGLARFQRREDSNLEHAITDLIRRADQALYAAKDQGRHQLCVAGDKA